MTALQRLKTAVAILEGLDHPNQFSRREYAKAIRILTLLEHVDRELPDVVAWCVVEVYTGSDWKDAVWSAHPNERAAKKEARRLNKKEKEEHLRHPWWGEYEICGARFVVVYRLASVNNVPRKRDP